MIDWDCSLAQTQDGIRIVRAKDVTEQDCKLITLENVISTGIYNDLGFQVRDKLFLAVSCSNI